MFYQKATERLRRSDFFKNLAVLTSGTAAAQAISVFTAPALTRIYHPADYGLLGVYMTFCALLSTLSTLQYSHAIVVAKDTDEAKQALKVSMVINLLVSVLVLLFLVFLRFAIAAVYNNPALATWLWWAPVSIFFVGINTVFSSWAIRKGEFKLLSRNRIYTALLAPLFSISIGLLWAGSFGLFVGLLISQVIPTLRMSYFFYWKDEFDFNLDCNKLREVMRSYRNFPRFSLPSEFINSFTNQMPVIMLSQLADPRVVGWYNLSVRMLGLPASLIATSVGEIFRQRAVKDYHDAGTCRPIFLKTFKFLSLLALGPFIILLLFGPEIFAFVFGDRWHEAGVIAQILSFLYAFKFIISPLSYTTNIANKQWVGLVIDVVLLLLLLGTIYFSKSFHVTYTTSLLIFSTVYCSLYFLTFYLSYKFTVNERFPS